MGLKVNLYPTWPTLLNVLTYYGQKVKIGPYWDWKFQKLNFEASTGSVYWFKMTILIKIIEGHHKLTFETICIDVQAFWGFPEAKM